MGHNCGLVGGAVWLAPKLMQAGKNGKVLLSLLASDSPFTIEVPTSGHSPSSIGIFVISDHLFGLAYILPMGQTQDQVTLGAT